MPVSNFAGLLRMSKPMRVGVPDWLANLFDGLDDDPATRRLVAASVAAEMCARLEEEGFTEFHIYTLNRAELTLAICKVLGFRTEPAP
jgi:methylenetetrahydrofolate reductase (NADPH)